MMNKRGFIKLLLFLSLVIITSSCGINNKESYLNSFERFVVELEEAKNISKEELTSAKKEYLDFIKMRYERSGGKDGYESIEMLREQIKEKLANKDN